VRIARSLARLSVVIGMFFVFATPWVAQGVPGLINYQGELMDNGGNPLNSTVSIVFKIYNLQTGGTTLWQETHNSVQVQQGVFSVLLGSVSPFPATLFDGDSRWLAIKVGSDSEMTPRSRIASVAYAIRAEKADEAATADYAATAGSAPADNDWGISGSNVYIPSGNVGIGTNSPTAPLHVYNSSGETNVTIESNGGNAKLDIDGADAYVNFERYGSYKGAVGYRTAGDYLYLHKGGYVVLKDGKLGVGEDNPQARLDVSGEVRLWNKLIAHPDSDGLELTDNDGNTRVKIRDDAVEVADNSGNTRLKVINNGNVGIGTTSPNHPLHAKKASGNYEAKIETDSGEVDLILDGTSGNSTVTFQQNGSFLGSVGYDMANDYLFLWEGGKVVVDDGKLGVGTDSPAETLDVEGSMKVGTSGTPFLEIREIAGTTHASYHYKHIPYPPGYTQDNTRVLCVEIKRSNNNTVYGLNAADINYLLAPSDIIIYYEDSSLMKGVPYRIVLMKTK